MWKLQTPIKCACPSASPAHWHSGTLNPIAMAKTTVPPLTRRFWLQLLPALAVAQQGTAPAQPQRITKDMVIAALGAMGLEFTGPQIDMLLPAVNRQLASFDALRAIDIPLDTP